MAPPPGGAGPAATAKGAAGGSVKGPSSRPAVAGNCGIDAVTRVCAQNAQETDLLQTRGEKGCFLEKNASRLQKIAILQGSERKRDNRFLRFARNDRDEASNVRNDGGTCRLGATDAGIMPSSCFSAGKSVNLFPLGVSGTAYRR